MEKINISESMTSFQLLNYQNKAAERTFYMFIDDLLAGKNISLIKQDETSKRRMHFSYEVPNGGFLDLSWDGKKISSFLRSMDYSNLQVLGIPKVNFQGMVYIWEDYVIEKCVEQKESVSMIENNFFIVKNGYKIQLRNIGIE